MSPPGGRPTTVHGGPTTIHGGPTTVGPYTWNRMICISAARPQSKICELLTAFGGFWCDSTRDAADALLMVSCMTKAHRLEGFDYSTNSGYFITMCTHRRQAILTGECHDIADRELEDLPRRFDGVTLDCHVVMPDHAHAILIMIGCPSTLSIVVQAYKSITARKIRQRIQTERVWQRGFYDRVIRNEIELMTLRKYVEQNPILHAARGHHR